MKLVKLSKSFEALEYMKKMMLPFTKTREIRGIRELIRSEAEMCQDEERKLIMEHAKANIHGQYVEDGKITFKSQKDMELFQIRLKELHEMEIELEFEPVFLSVDDIGDQKISQDYIDRLKGFIEFGGD